MLSTLEKNEQAPRRYPFRASAALTVKLLIIGASVLALLWIVDLLVAS